VKHFGRPMDDDQDYDGDMDEGGGGRGRGDGDPLGLRRRGGKRRVCRYCAEPGTKIDYKDSQSLKFFITERGKIVPRRISGNCALHQREVTIAIKRARTIALMPYTAVG